MSPLRWFATAGLAMLLTATAAQAQQAQRALQPPPHLGYVYPAGGRQGTTVDVTLGGQFLRGATGVHVWGEGLQATVGKYHKPINAQEYFRLQEKMQELKKRAQAERAKGSFGGRAAYHRILRELDLTEDDVNDVRAFVANATNPKRQINVQIAETLVLQIKLAANASPGPRELRLITEQGLSNPLIFYVGGWSECRKGETSGPRSETEVDALPVVLNGQILPGGGADRFAFQARKGMRLVAVAAARDLMPYLADAVPGWFQAVMTLYDPDGKEVAYADDDRFQPDPVLHYEVPADGRYVLEIKDALDRGRQDFVYRIALGEQPFVRSIFPLGGREGTPATVALGGWNLQADTLTLHAAHVVAGSSPVVAQSPDHATSRRQRISKDVAFAWDTLPECLEREPNDRPENAQPVTLPIIVNGRIDRPGDWDVFRFEGRAGSPIVAEVTARRLGSPVDSLLKLTDASGRLLAANDDYDDKGSPLVTHQADSWLWATLPADGTYYLHLGDTQHNGGPEYGYRLRISPPRPDFELRVVPSSLNVRAGMCVPITVYALRHDRFTGDIALALRDAPAGFALSGGLLPGDQEKVRLTLSVPPTATEKPLRLSLEGRAVIDRRPVSRVAVPAEDMLQAFAYHHLVPARELLVAIAERRWANMWWRLADEKTVRLPAGKTAHVRFSMPGGPRMDRIQLVLNEPPDGIAVASVSPTREGVDVVLRADAEKVKPGLRGNLIMEATIEWSPDASQGKPAGEKRRVPIGTLPAIPFEIVARS